MFLVFVRTEKLWSRSPDLISTSLSSWSSCLQVEYVVPQLLVGLLKEHQKKVDNYCHLQPHHNGLREKPIRERIVLSLSYLVFESYQFNRFEEREEDFCLQFELPKRFDDYWHSCIDKKILASRRPFRNDSDRCSFIDCISVIKKFEASLSHKI